MGPFRRKEFKKSPLAPNVPLEGSDTVLGLRQLERQRLAEASPFRTLAPDRLFQSNPGRRNYTRYKGPFLEETRLDSLRAPPRPWPQFLHHGANSSVIVAYNVPEDVRMLCERLDENLVYYLVNYIYVALAVLLLLVLFRPTAIIGLGVSAASLYFNLVLVPSLPPLQQEDSNIATVKMVLMILSWVAALYTRCMSVLLRWMLYSAALVLLHASLRRSGSEYAAAAQNARRPLGVPFSQVLGFSWRRRGRFGASSVVSTAGVPPEPVTAAAAASSSASRGGARSDAAATGVGTTGWPEEVVYHDDPRRVFRELGSAGWQLSLVLAVQLQQVVQHYWLQLDDALRYRSGWRYPRRVRTYPVQ